MAEEGKTGETSSKWVQWRWVGLNACMLGSAITMARVSGEAEILEGLLPPEVKMACGGLGVESLCSLCFMFIMGLSKGLFWKGSSKYPHSAPPPKTLTTVGSLKQYRLKEIVDMTDRFKLELGRGGQGIVYFASLPEGRGTAAVKRLQKKSRPDKRDDNHAQEVLEKEFWAELKTISRSVALSTSVTLACFFYIDLYCV